MAKTSLMNCQLRLSEVEINLRVTPILEIGFGIKRRERNTLSDFSYGEFLFFIGDVPTFYFDAFDNQGKKKRIVQDSENAGIALHDYLFKVLLANNYKVTREKWSLIRRAYDDKSYMKKFPLLSIVDCI